MAATNSRYRVKLQIQALHACSWQPHPAKLLQVEDKVGKLHSSRLAGNGNLLRTSATQTAWNSRNTSASESL
jgi:hypothetical protein